jgi:hypothetical protein
LSVLRKNGFPCREEEEEAAGSVDPVGDLVEIGQFAEANRDQLALIRRSTLDRTVKQMMERTGQVITVYKKGSRVAACKGSFRTGQLRAIQNTEDWCIWASHAVMGVGTRTDLMHGLKQ